MTLTITHTHPEGTLIDGTAKGDGTADILKTHRWRWGRSIGAWYIPHSRDKTAAHHRIETTATALRTAGFTVTIDINNTPRTTAEVEADKTARAQDRAEALTAKAERKAAAAEAADEAQRRALEQVPPGGEPIKVGHHSEARHRRSIARAHNALGRSVEADREAAAAAQRAKTASAATDARYAPSTVANRIDRLEAEDRKIARHLNGYTAQRGTPYSEEVPPATGAFRERWTAEAARVADELNYWIGVRADQVATGEATDYSRETINPGDYVTAGRSGGWWRVKRVNPKTVTLEAHGCSIKAPYGTITGHRAGPERQS